MRAFGLVLLVSLLLVSLCACGDAQYSAVAPGEIRIHFIDVGQADSTLIRTSDAVILVDSGGTDPVRAEALMRYLRRLRIDTVDCLILTHPHTDHIGGAALLLQNFTVRECRMIGAVTEEAAFGELLSALSAEGCLVREAYCGQTESFGELTLSVLSPDAMSTESLNDKSLVLRVSFHENTLLLPGDISAAKEEELLEIYGAEGLQAGILKAAHHGSHLSSGEAFLDAVSPQYTVLSCAEGNEYGYPTSELLERFWQRGIRVLRTDLDGTVVFSGDGEGYQLLTHN